MLSVSNNPSQQERGRGEVLNYESPTNIDLLIEMAIKRAYDGKVSGNKPDAALWKANADKLWQGVKDGIAKNPEKMTYASPEQRRMLEMRYNVNVTAAFKMHHNSLELANALFDQNGVKRTFAEFKKAVKPILEDYNKNYLRTEWNLANASASAAMKWVGFEEKGGMLVYRTQRDGRVRDAHIILDGTTKPVNDPFWNNYYPPNGWGCRCFVRWMPSDTTSVEPKGIPDMPDMFKNNVGKTGKVFTENTAYFTIDQQYRKAAARDWGFKMPLSPDEIKRNAAIFDKLANDKLFTPIMVDNLGGGFVFKSNLAAKAEVIQITPVAQKLAYTNGDAVVINPIIKSPGFKNPDITINNIVVEVKTNYKATASAIDNALRRGKEQAQYILINIMSDIPSKMLEKAIYDRVQRAQSILSVTVLYNGKIVKLKRSEIINRTFFGKL